MIRLGQSHELQNVGLKNTYKAVTLITTTMTMAGSNLYKVSPYRHIHTNESIP